MAARILGNRVLPSIKLMINKKITVSSNRNLQIIRIWWWYNKSNRRLKLLQLYYVVWWSFLPQISLLYTLISLYTALWEHLMCFFWELALCMFYFMYIGIFSFLLWVPQSEVLYGFRQKIIMVQLSRGIYRCWFPWVAPHVVIVLLFLLWKCHYMWK